MKKFLVFFVLLLCVGGTGIISLKTYENIQSKEDLALQKEQIVSVLKQEEIILKGKEDVSLSDDKYYDVDFQNVLTEDAMKESEEGDE